ncbi:hypothetical protein [Helicobacter bizzozeronii]|uniref:hypothetical protein n=1 Tax=Helicobacter bizzozeronii TaxID=56877 RepID=UPI001F3BE4CD|nr:hypothetical protein [Helicobacter bizzozeronii]
MDNQGDQFDQWNEQKKKIQAKVAKNLMLKTSTGFAWVTMSGMKSMANLQASHAPYLVLKMLSARLFLGIPLK